ncbi:hypothetical protein DUI87_01958 [Hirundo rustica rustica]|uniref:Peptidase A2 domain-containing protein n=1 Tax=Hirundo rustica rustica TaxID=333673 RepID=A0A3M0L7M7_HIRRU|nr:hypothetical protein DUI87_01958 [Hirundo rustica rustica]
MGTDPTTITPRAQAYGPMRVLYHQEEEMYRFLEETILLCKREVITGSLFNTPDWQVVTVDPGQVTNLQQPDSKYLVIGDSKHTPSEIEIAPGPLPSGPEQLALLAHCIHPPLFLPKGQVIARAIPLPKLPYDDLYLSVYWAEMVEENKSIIWCGLKRERDFIQLQGMMDTGSYMMVIPPHKWLSHWELQPVAGKVTGIGGTKLAKQSKSIVQIERPDEQLASLHPFVLYSKFTLWGRDAMFQWGVKLEISKNPREFFIVATEERPFQKLNWLTDIPIWMDQWPLNKQKLKELNGLVEEQLAKGHIVETNSPWNSLVFVIKKPGKDKWCLLYDLRKINEVIKGMGSLQPGMPSLSMLPKNWNLAVIDIKDCSFQIPLDPADIPWHFNQNHRLKFEEKLPVLVKDPETWKVQGPFDLVPWGRGYACVSTPTVVQGHECEDFQVMHCSNLSSRIQNVHDSIQEMKTIMEAIKQGAGDWLENIFKDRGVPGGMS